MQVQGAYTAAWEAVSAQVYGPSVPAAQVSVDKIKGAFTAACMALQWLLIQ